ncbi:MAG TPA: hypothetical protein VGV36_06970 [Solirubrobacteraceae bacterium]|nr:hypothetical protein [Solirubrobacteraceae bacterium]
MAKHAEETVTLRLPISEAYERCKHATEALSKSKLKEADEAAHRVQLKTKMSIKSWGEKVELTLSPEGDDATRVHVLSKASVGTTMVDYGKNQANVNSVVSWLQNSPA